MVKRIRTFEEVSGAEHRHSTPLAEFDDATDTEIAMAALAGYKVRVSEYIVGMRYPWVFILPNGVVSDAVENTLGGTRYATEREAWAGACWLMCGRDLREGAAGDEVDVFEYLSSQKGGADGQGRAGDHGAGDTA